MSCCSCTYMSTENNILRVVIFGLENSGKTSLVHCLKTSNKVSNKLNYMPTHDVISMNIHLNIQSNLNLLIFDCGGCKHQRHIWPHLINDSDLILFTVDSNDLNCLNDAKQALFDLLFDENLNNKPLLIVFTKSDKQKNINIGQLERALDLFMIKDRPIHKVLFSSVTLDGLTSISAWFTYFNHRKFRGNKIKILANNSVSSSTKYQLPKSLHLTTLSDSSTSSHYQSQPKTTSVLKPKNQKSLKKIIKK